MKTTIQQNRNLIDYAEYHDLVYGTETNNTHINGSLRKRVLEALFEIHSDSFPNNSRRIKECILQGQEVLFPEKTQYMVKSRFTFAIGLYSKFLEDVVNGEWIEKNGYGNSGELINSPEQSREEFILGWNEMERLGLNEKLFHRMAKRTVEEFLFNASGQKSKAPNQAWMDLFGFNEHICSYLRMWFDQNLLLTA